MRGILTLVVWLSSCTRPSSSVSASDSVPDSASVSASVSVSVSASASASASVSASESKALVALPVTGFDDALVAAPSTADTRPVLVATHGHGEPPDGICRVFQHIVKERGYVLCLAGTRWPISGMHTYLSERALGEELDAALIALHARFPQASTEGAIYAGFSMGATFGVGPLVARAKRLPRALMIEGGVGDWSAGRIHAYAVGGGLRVLFACGLRRRLPLATSIAATMRAEGLAAEVVLGADENGNEAGHTYYGDVARVVGERFSWLVEGDPRWSN